MTMNEEIKKSKRLPLHIKYAVFLCYAITLFIGIIFLQLLVALNIENIRNLAMITFTIIAPLIGFSVGWYLKFRYVSKEENENQLLRIKAQFWGAMAFLISFIVSILLIMMLLIQLENMLPESAPDPIIFLISMSIIGISLFIANNAKKRIYRNFGYQ